MLWIIYRSYIDTVDGRRNPELIDGVSIPVFCWGFNHPRWFLGFRRHIHSIKAHIIQRNVKQKLTGWNWFMASTPMKVSWDDTIRCLTRKSTICFD